MSSFLIFCAGKRFFAAGTFLLIFGAAFGSAAEGPPSQPSRRLRQIDIQGNHNLSRSDIDRLLRLKIGRRLREKKWEESCARLRQGYLERGFIELQLSTEIIRSPSGLTASISVREGLSYRLNAIDVNGNTNVSPDAIKRELEMRPGDPFNPIKLMEGRKRLYATGLFESVNLILSSAPASTVDLRVDVRERGQRFLKGGAGYGTETKERLSVGWEDQSFLGGARRADIKYTYSGFLTQPEKNETRSLEATLITPFILGTRLENQFTLERENKFREAYDSIETELRTSLERRYKAFFSLRLTYRLQGTDLTRVSPEAETPSVTSVNAIGTSLRFDNTDDPFLPLRGWRALASFEEGLKWFKNDVGFHKIEMRLGRFDTTESGWTFFEGIQTGLLLPLSGDTADVIPINERFFLGGANSVRGYAERSLGPKDSDGASLGGTFFFVTNLEARRKLYKKLFGLAFVDVGNLFDYDPKDMTSSMDLNSLNDLAQSAGLGVRYHSIAGAIRFEVGYQLNPEHPSASSKERTALHFSIGEVF